VRQQASELSIPVIALKNDSESRVVNALRAIVGVDPSPGGLFGNPEEAFDTDPVHGRQSFKPASQAPAQDQAIGVR
jgi:hypothetical protein